MTLMHGLKRKIKNGGKKGSMTFTSLIIAGFLLLAGLFFMVDIPLKLIMSNELVDNLNNATSSAVTLIDEDQIKTGTLFIDEKRATDAVYGMVAELYNLDLDASKRNFALKETSRLSKPPKIEVWVVNRPKNSSPDTWKQTKTMLNGEVVTVKESSVVVTAEMNFKPLVRKNDDGLVVTRTSASQVAFPEMINKN